MKTLVPALMMILTACGSSDSSESSAEQRICEAVVGCGELEDSDEDACVSDLEDVDGTRAKSECADCMEASSCGEAARECAEDCDTLLVTTEVHETVAREICVDWGACLDLTSAQVADCMMRVMESSELGEARRCRDCLERDSCEEQEFTCELECNP
jgi:hypothetical protein